VLGTNGTNAIRIQCEAFAIGTAEVLTGVSDGFQDFVAIWADDDLFSNGLFRALGRIDGVDAVRRSLCFHLWHAKADAGAVVASTRKSKLSTAALMDMIPDKGTVAEFHCENVNEILRVESSRIEF
jgi:hypothetical protein